jgi:hypothetical protein
MKHLTPCLIEDSNLSHAWARALLAIMDGSGKEISPLVLSVTEFSEDGAPAEDPVIRGTLDRLLAARGFIEVETVAFTIFPQEIWDAANGSRATFFRLAQETFPRYRSMNPRANRWGLYWQRLMMFDEVPGEGNQLKFILDEYARRPGVRRSMFQAAVFDPRRDHRPSPYLPFPCLQHVSFVPTAKGLVLNAFYATQQLFDKAYGNYLGLSRLGAFMAREMGLPFARLNVYVGVEKLERIQKTDPTLLDFAATLRSAIHKLRPGAAVT